jgi:hypothetical protein
MNLDNFKRSVEGAMKLLSVNCQCIFHLATGNNFNCSRKNYCSITICVQYVLKYFVEFCNFVEGVVGRDSPGLDHALLLAVAVHNE